MVPAYLQLIHMQVCVPPVPCRRPGWRTSQDGAVLGGRPPAAMDKGTCTYLYSAVTLAHSPLSDFFHSYWQTDGPLTQLT